MQHNKAKMDMDIKRKATDLAARPKTFLCVFNWNCKNERVPSLTIGPANLRGYRCVSSKPLLSFC